MSSSTRLVKLTALLMAVAASAACNKSGSTESPGAGNGADEAAADGVRLRYSVDGRKLHQTMKFQMNQSGGGQYAEANLELAALMELASQGDKLKVVWNIQSVDTLDVGGALEGSEGAEDPKVFLKEKGRGAFIIDVRGETDDDATESLPENETRRAELQQLAEKSKTEGKPGIGTGAQLLAYLPPILTLPPLPEGALTLGKPVTHEHAEELELDGIGVVVPMDIASTHTLIKIDESGGNRIAEVKFEGEASGAAEIQGQMVTIESGDEGTLLFDLNKGIPLSYEITRNEAFGLGENQGESTMIIHATWVEQPR
jgi:hypothetical protein